MPWPIRSVVAISGPALVCLSCQALLVFTPESQLDSANDASASTANDASADSANEASGVVSDAGVDVVITPDAADGGDGGDPCKSAVGWTSVYFEPFDAGVPPWLAAQQSPPTVSADAGIVTFAWPAGPTFFHQGVDVPANTAGASAVRLSARIACPGSNVDALRLVLRDVTALLWCEGKKWSVEVTKGGTKVAGINLGGVGATFESAELILCASGVVSAALQSGEHADYGVTIAPVSIDYPDKAIRPSIVGNGESDAVLTMDDLDVSVR